MKTLHFALLVSFGLLPCSGIEIVNKQGKSFEATVMEVLPNAPGGASVKVRRENDGQIFTVQLSVLSEKTLIDLLIEMSREREQGQGAAVPAKKPQVQQPKPNAQRGKKVNGYSILKSTDKTAEDVNVDFEMQGIELDDDTMTLQGRLKNNSKTTFELCKVTVELLDNQGDFVIRDSTFAEPSDIKPNQIANVELFIFSDLLTKKKVHTIVYKVTGIVEK